MISKNEQIHYTMQLFMHNGIDSAIRYIMQEPYWESSETLVSESWKNPLLTFQDRLLIADGAYAFQEKVIDNLRTRIKLLETQLAKLTPSRCESCKYDSHNGDISEACIKCNNYSNWEPK